MWIICPNCQNRSQVEPAVTRGATFRARCSKCEHRFDVDVDTGQVVTTSARSAPTPKPGTLTPPPRAATDAATTSGPRVDPSVGGRPLELVALLQEVNDQFDDLMKRDPFVLLGIHVESTNQEVMDAYFRLTERYRASRWQGFLSDEESQRLWQVMLKVDEAFNELGDAERRRRSHQMRSANAERRSKTEIVSGARAALIKEQLDADSSFDAGRFEDARSAYQRCIALAPERGIFHLRLGQSLMREAAAANKHPDWLTVERTLEKALGLEPENLDALMALGEMWTARGQASRAMPYFKRVRDVEPNHPGANQAIDGYLSGKQPTAARHTTTERLFRFLRRDV